MLFVIVWSMTYSKPYDSELFVSVSVSSCSLLFCDDSVYIQCCLHRVLRFCPFYALNIAIDCFIILGKIF